MSPQNFTYLFLFVLMITSCKTKSGIILPSTGMKTAFEINNNYSASYLETIEYYKMLSQIFKTIKVSPFGMTDSGYPLHEVVIDKNRDFDPLSARKSGKTILFINNAIHPGEPCGVDASMMMARDLMEKKEWKGLLNNTVVVIIPFYNIGGGLNRGSYSRANQNGPEQYGFRGNAQNLDLNRDFIKCDTKNAESFNQLFNKWNPDVFIDNHTSNGADYQYVITLIATQKDKLESNLSKYMQDKMLPELYKEMKKGDYEMTPYVYARSTPDEGIAGFLDLPRYSSGYAALHNTISFMPETHMLKPFKDRVWSVYHFMKNMLEFLDDHSDDLLKVRNSANNAVAKAKTMDLNWKLNFEEEDKIEFKGYKATYKPSAISGKQRLYYDHNEPFKKKIPFYNTYSITSSVVKPNAYIIPQTYQKVIDRLKWNGVRTKKLQKDSSIEVSVYKIESYESVERPYEGHFLHSKVQVSEVKRMLTFRKGDIIVYTGQKKDRYIMETLEPSAPDSFFAWNFMDGVLSAKEYFSSYVFEDLAVEILKKDKNLRKDFEQKKKEDKEFADNARAQLRYIYEHSPHYEQQYMHYPVARID